MSIVVFQHEPHEPPARIGESLTRNGHRLHIIKLFEGQTVPVDLDDVDGVVSMGGAANVDETAKFVWLEPEMAYIKKAHDAGKPVVGICLGAQLIAAALGGKVAAMSAPEVGWKEVKLAFPGQTDVIFQGMPHNTMQFHLHGQEVTALPPDSTPLAGSSQCRNQAFRVGMTTYAFQYHFEWEAADIQAAMNDSLVVRSTQNRAQMMNDQVIHYGSYRRLGDRLCENLTIMLFNAAR